MLAIPLCVGPIQSAAREPGAPTSVPPGNTMGGAVGAGPPPGFYIASLSAYWPNKITDQNGDYGGHKSQVFNSAIALIWVSKAKVLGGRYRAHINAPLLHTRYEREPPFQPSEARGKGNDTAIGNLEISPINLNWEVSPGIHVGTGISFFLPFGFFDIDNTINSQTDFAAVGTHLAFSYLRDGWNISAFLAHYASDRSNTTKYKSGDEILFNFGALKDVGGWSIGPIGYWRKQITSDKNYGSYYGGTIAAKAEQIGLGVGVETKMNGLRTNINLSYDVYARQSLKGAKLWFKVLIPLGKS